MADACVYALGAKVDEVTIHEHIGPICLEVEPSIFLARTLLRSDVLVELIGESLARAVRRFEYEKDWQIEESRDATPVDMMSVALQELIDIKKQLIQVRAAVAKGRIDMVRDLVGHSMVLTSAKPKLHNLQHERNSESHQQLHQRVCILIGTNSSFSGGCGVTRNMKEVAEKGEYAQLHFGQNPENTKAERNYVLMLDEAIDDLALAHLKKARDDDRFHGFSFCSDESPAAALCYQGLRFQIPLIYGVVFEQAETWDTPAFQQKMQIQRI